MSRYLEIEIMVLIEMLFVLFELFKLLVLMDT